MLGKINKMYNFLQNPLNHDHWSINDGDGHDQKSF